MRAGLYPHVLFNVLNTISAHVETRPRQARWMLEQFASLLRLSLEHDREPEITLERELAYVGCYLDLQKARFEDRFDVVTKIAPDVLHAYVPTCILQPMVEHAVRHGVLVRSAGGQIVIEAFHDDRALHLSVDHNGPGLQSAGVHVGLVLPFRTASERQSSACRG
jgi:two-component system, LytTR family, sensor kinase